MSSVSKFLEPRAEVFIKILINFSRRFRWNVAQTHFVTKYMTKNDELVRTESNIWLAI
jgi:hypothetical protein